MRLARDFWHVASLVKEDSPMKRGLKWPSPCVFDDMAA